MSRLARPTPRPWASRRLICLSFAGGGTVGFRPWARQVPRDVELRSVCYPGREFRYGDEITGGWQGLVADCADAIAGDTRTPYVLYGHSMGALVAYEAARLLEAAGTGPESLVLSGHIAPQNWTGSRTKALATASDAELSDWLEASGGAPESVLCDPDLLDMAVELLRMDLQAYSGYHHDARPRLRAGIHLMVGEREVTQLHEGWSEVTDGPFSMEVLPGGHFFTPQLWRSLPGRMPLSAESGLTAQGAR